MLCKCHWIVLYTVHFTAFCLGGPFFSGHGVYLFLLSLTAQTKITNEQSCACIKSYSQKLPHNTSSVPVQQNL